MDWETPNCGCGHPWEDHSLEVGCRVDWEYIGADPGVASEDGCACPLAHTQRSNHDG